MAGRPGIPAKALVVLLVLMALGSAIHASGNALALWGSMDLGQPLKASQELMREDPYRRFLQVPIGPDAQARPDANPFGVFPVQVPSALMLLWPYAMLSWPGAKLAWLISNLLFTAGLLLLAFRRLLPGRSPWLYAAIGALFVIGMPWRNIIANGQHLLASLFLFLLALELADRRRPVPAGIALAAALLKYTVILFLLPYLILKRQWLPIAVALAIHAAMTLAIALRLHTDPATLVLESFRIAIRLQPQGYVDLSALTAASGIPPMLALAAGALLFGMEIWIAAVRPTRDEALFLAALCLLAPLLVYHRAYDFVLLIVPLLVAIDRWPQAKPLTLLVSACVALVWFVSTARPYAAWMDGRGPYYWLVAGCCWAAAAAAWILLGRGSGQTRPGRDRP
ncbi:MAG: glycosyltransferase 87 family protein [Sphingomonadales bacterium]